MTKLLFQALTKYLCGVIPVGLLLFLPVLIPGSWIGFAVMLVYPIVIVLRIRNEEAVLTAGLDGYMEYKTKVKWRLIPFIW